PVVSTEATDPATPRPRASWWYTVHAPGSPADGLGTVVGPAPSWAIGAMTDVADVTIEAEARSTPSPGHARALPPIDGGVAAHRNAMHRVRA
ncbi:MAG: hypothetical protein ACRD1G_00560, partial [Acidimicrobiales bacterium]